MKSRISIRWPLCASLVLLLGAAPARANLWTVTGSTSSGPVAASAVVTVAPGSITVTLTNWETNPTDVGQLLSGVIFTVSDKPGSLSLDSAAGTLRTINSDLSFSDTTLAGNQAGWVLNESDHTIALDDLSGQGHAGPAHLLIGDPGGSTYSAAAGLIAGNGADAGNGAKLTTTDDTNPLDVLSGQDHAGPAHLNIDAPGGSIAGNGAKIKTPYNPFIAREETWTISGPSITSSTQITGVTFQFGTHDGQDQLAGTDPPSVPEPSTLALTGLGALGFLGYALRRRMME